MHGKRSHCALRCGRSSFSASSAHIRACSKTHAPLAAAPGTGSVAYRRFANTVITSGHRLSQSWVHVVKPEQVFQLHCTCDWSAMNTWAAAPAFAGCKATPAQPPGFTGALQGVWGALTSTMAHARALGAADGPSMLRRRLRRAVRAAWGARGPGGFSRLCAPGLAVWLAGASCHDITCRCKGALVPCERKQVVDRQLEKN